MALAFLLGLAVNIEYNRPAYATTAGSTTVEYEPTAGFHVQYQGRSIYCENTLTKDNKVQAVCLQ